jgi:hypothetical protein
VVGVAPESHRELADLLDQFIGLGAFLHPDHIAQNAAQQADVFDQGALAVAFFAVAAGAGLAGGQGGSGAACFIGCSAAGVVRVVTSRVKGGVNFP